MVFPKLKTENDPLSIFLLLCLGIMKTRLLSDFLMVKNSHYSKIKLKSGYLNF